MKYLPSNFFIRVPTEELNQLVQNKLFQLGYHWNYEGEKAKTINTFHYGKTQIIQINSTGKMYYGVMFAHDTYPEISLLELFTLCRSKFFLECDIDIEVTDEFVKMRNITLTWDKWNKLKESIEKHNPTL